MPDLEEFFNPQIKKIRNYELEHLSGIRGCSQCEEDVPGALWDPVEKEMYWKCLNGHETIFKVD